MVLLRKPTIRKSHQKLPNESTFSKSKKKNNSPNIENLLEKESELNEKNTKNNVIIKKAQNKIKLINKYNKSKRLARDSNYRIVKEYYDEDKYDFIEEELFRMGEGYCFGEWALIYKQPRSASIYTLEDCVFFTLDETPFKNSFLKSLNNSEFNKKKFALKNFLPFDMTDERQLSIYKNIVPINCKSNQIIFNEGDISDSIYLIYLGSFTLEKKYGYKQFSILNLEKGSIVGLETLFEGDTSKYKCSLKLSAGFDFGIIFQLKINKLRPYIINKMKISFKENYNLFLNSWKEFFKKNLFVRQSISNKLSKENKKEGKNELFVDVIGNSENNIDIYGSNYNSILNLKKENKYETLFKKCYTKKIGCENRKKDGSLRIFSSKQRSRIYGGDEENNKKLDNVNIIKYFKEFTKRPQYDRKTLKTAHQLRLRKLKSLNHSEIFYSDNNTMRKTNHKSIGFQGQYIKESNMKYEDITQKYSKTESEMCLVNDKKTFSVSFQTFKINKKTNIKFNFDDVDNNAIKESERYKINHQNGILELVDNNKQNENLKLNIIKQSIYNRKNNGMKIKDNINIKISKMNYNIIQKLKEKQSKSRTIHNYDLKEKNIPYKMKRKNFNNHTGFRNSINVSSNANRTIKKNFSATQGLLSSRNNHKIRLLLKNEKNNEKKLFKNNYSQRNLKFFTRKNSKSSININRDKNRKNKDTIMNYNSEKQTSKKLTSYKEITIFSGKNSNIFKEFNLNNGFSVSYFKNINQINDFNNYEIVKKRPQFSSCTNKFKITFDSGDFNIPLVSSSLSLKKYK